MVPPPPTRTSHSAGARALYDVFGEPPAPARPEDWAFYLAPEVAGIFFGFGQFAHYDPWTYARPNPTQGGSMPWPEHAQGRVRTSVNSQGCRETHELSDPPRDLRVLVAGDSHTFGVCDDTEVLSEVLEVSLQALRPGRSIEVLNAASGGYTFTNYLGTWFRFREFRPQVLLVVVFAGNDFGELLAHSLHFSGFDWPPGSPGRNEGREAALASDPYAMAQGLDSIETAREWPEERVHSIDDAVYLCREMQRYAAVDGAKLVVAFVPSPLLLKWPEGLEPGAKSVQAFGLLPEDFQRESEQDRRFLEGVREAGIEVVDLTASFEAEPTPPFWRRDLHMSTRAHELTAKALLPVVERSLPR